MRLQKNPSKLFCENWLADFKLYMERQKTQNHQHNIEEEQQSWRVDVLDFKT